MRSQNLDPLFPLALTAWEEFCFRDDHPGYPAQFATQIEFEGPLDPTVAEQALQICAGRHPLFTCCVVAEGRQLKWVPSGAALSLELIQVPQDDFELPPFRHVDLSRNLPTRPMLVMGTTTSRLVVYFHHSVCDGLGAIQFVIEWIQIYDALILKTAVGEKVRRLDPRLLAGRGHYSQTVAEFLRSARYQLKSVQATARLLFQRIETLVPKDSIRISSAQTRTRLAYCTRRFATDETAFIEQEAVRLGSSVNTLILRDVFTAIDEWLGNPASESGRAIRIIAPHNEREYADRRMPACNRCSLSPLSRSRSGISDREKLRQSLDRTAQAIHAGRLGLNFHRMLNLYRRLPGGLSRFTRSDRISATCLVTNLGKLHTRRLQILPDGTGVAGGVRVRGMDIIAPIRPGMAVSLAVFVYAGQLNITMHYDSLLLDDLQAARLLQGVSDRLLTGFDNLASRQAGQPLSRVA